MFLVWHLQADAQVYERYFCIFFQNQLVCPIITTTWTWLNKRTDYVFAVVSTIVSNGEGYGGLGNYRQNNFSEKLGNI